MSVCVCLDPLLTRAGRQPAAGALVPLHRLQHGKEKMAHSRCTYSHQQHQHAGRPPSFLSTSRNAERWRGTVSQQRHNPAHMSAPPERTHKPQKTPPHDFRTSFRHTATRQTEVFVTPCTSPHNHIVHASRTAAAHTRSNKCSPDHCYPRAAVGSKQKGQLPNPKRVPRLAAIQRNAATQMNSVLVPSASHFLPQKAQKLPIKRTVQ
ncbi:hypothetical protein Tc00.1047053503587.6 [Trypanosoma cruzi]|uniref:Uncharacterized protein n=1 Tax=Trypanosoma cruzi (strain CL Brener) TaxID=353153 RepID=Q4DC33_TRYCC|nr:hypothetical protein Tc00.1047053503587.6 [Trypanosoma cruzi]EAN90085.1 hypothetical protein Tc00.1047053503587.6 [Trypanosoma cruzi]|eukprot:XP_811936.1 hypothetical protein [Trypanosoma cruzi strain CL Brener]